MLNSQYCGWSFIPMKNSKQVAFHKSSWRAGSLDNAGSSIEINFTGHSITDGESILRPFDFTCDLNLR